MNPHPRIRKTIKWGGAAVTVLLVVVWVGSGWIAVRRLTLDGLQFRIESGQIEVGFEVGQPIAGTNPQWTVYASRANLRWMPSIRGATAFRWVYVPLWIPAAGSAFISVAAWRLDTLARRRAKLNLCAKCGYDRTGLARDAKCPECGAIPVSV